MYVHHENRSLIISLALMRSATSIIGTILISVRLLVFLHISIGSIKFLIFPLTEMDSTFIMQCHCIFIIPHGRKVGEVSHQV